MRDIEKSDNSYAKMDLLRLATAGSVDDGKSTLIGRLLYDSKNTFEDQMEAVMVSSKKRGDENINLALLTDGLKAEREQGITIDVAYRYFATPKRKFIIADTPGHIQYTRNMVTGASTADLAILLIDARKGIIEQTCRHTFIANLLGIQHILIAVNKMDLVDYSQERYDEITDEYSSFISRLQNIVDVTYIPISALHGDNIVEKSDNMSWYEGASLLYTLENIYIHGNHNHIEARFPIQGVIRPHSDKYHDFRGYSGRVSGGVFKPGDDIVVYPSGFSTKISKILLADKEISEAFSPQSVTILLENELDISRGNMIAKVNRPPNVGQDIQAMMCWFSQNPLKPKTKYTLLHTSNKVKAIIKKVDYKVNINTLHRIDDEVEIKMNDIFMVEIRTSSILFYDSYRKNRNTGSFILIDPQTYETVAAGMIR